MEGNRRIGVRYCGGCNPRYDRVALVRELESLLSRETFVPAQEGVPYAAILVVCGCPSRCATVSGLTAPLVYMGAPEELLSVRDALQKLLDGHR